MYCFACENIFFPRHDEMIFCPSQVNKHMTQFIITIDYNLTILKTVKLSTVNKNIIGNIAFVCQW